MALAGKPSVSEYIFAVGLHGENEAKVVFNANKSTAIYALCQKEAQAKLVAESFDEADCMTYWPVIAKMETDGSRLTIIIDNVHGTDV